MAFFHKAFDKVKGAFRKTAAVLNTDVRTLFVPGRQIDDAFLTEMEERFLKADMGVRNVDRLVGAVRERWRLGKIRNGAEAERVVREQMVSGWGGPETRELRLAAEGPTVIMVAGVNGAGKTTTIAKLCWLLKEQMGKRVMVAAADTFRAAAVDQLTVWAGRMGVDIVKHKQGADPAAVAYDACEAAKSCFQAQYCPMSLNQNKAQSSCNLGAQNIDWAVPVRRCSSCGSPPCTWQAHWQA